jgi:hypothetical protein
MPHTLGLFLLAVSAFAQSGQTPPENAEEPVIKAGTEEVMLDVVVRDKHGRRVTNLQPEDLQIFDNGTECKVRSFRLVLATQPPVRSGTATPTPQPPAESGRS